MIASPMELDAALKEVVRLTWEYQETCARNFYCAPFSPPLPAPGENPEYDRIGFEQHQLHVRLFEARQRFNSLVAQ